jgi:sugar/nucleoside kinase (ribokinase family)
LLESWPLSRCARAGNVAAAAALGGLGDWETLPRLEEFERALARAEQGHLSAKPPAAGRRRFVPT